MQIAPPVAVVDPKTVFIADYGYHSSLLLPRPEGGLVEYAFGEWAWFAEGQTQGHRAVGLAFVASDGTLGRREYPAPATTEQLRRWLPVEALHPVTVERERAAALRDRLDAEFETGRAVREHHNHAHRLWFVPAARNYHGTFYNCNTAVAEWLEELGCRVTGARAFSAFELVEPS